MYGSGTWAGRLSQRMNMSRGPCARSTSRMEWIILDEGASCPCERVDRNHEKLTGI